MSSPSGLKPQERALGRSSETTSSLGAELLLLAALTVCWFLAFAASPARADAGSSRGPVAIARLITGAATMSSTDTAPQDVIRTGTRIPSGWYVWVIEGSLIELTLPDSHVVRLGPAATTVRWQQGRLQTVAVTVFHGQAYSTVRRLPDDGAYRVITPTRVAAVRGTEFAVQVGENGATRTAVKKGEVGMGEGEPDRVLEANDEDEAYLAERGEQDGDTDWLKAQSVPDSAAAADINKAAAEQMQLTNEMTTQDFVELASVTQDVLGYVIRRPRSAGEISNAATSLLRGVKLFRRMEARRGSMEARQALAQRLQARYGVGDAGAGAQFAEFETQRAQNGSSFDTFIDRLESLAGFLRTAQAVSSSPVGAVIPHLPGGFFGR